MEGTVSPANPILITAENGYIHLKNSRVNIKAHDITPHPQTQAIEYLIQVAQGSVHMDKNIFKLDKSYTAGLLITTANLPTSNFKITNNRFENFHGVLYLINSNNADISDNVFYQNSYGHIVNVGNNIKISGNHIYFSGNDRLGNAIDIIDSDGG